MYYHDVLNSPERACHLAKHAFDEAVQCLDDSPSKADAVMILQLLRDDLLLWVSEIQGVPAKVSGLLSSLAPMLKDRSQR